MKITENDHSVGVVFPTSTGAIDSKGCKNCWTCDKFLIAIRDHRVEMECLAHTDCTNGSEWFHINTNKATFRKDWRVFFDTIKGQTFTVSENEYSEAEEKYKEAIRICEETKNKKGIIINPTFEIKGHVAWLYRLDEDYTEEIKKYESTHSKS